MVNISTNIHNERITES